MKRELGQTGDAHILEYSIEDSSSVDSLYKQCAEFISFSSGIEPCNGMGESLFLQVPFGLSKDIGQVIGIENAQRECIGVLHLLRGYPSSDVWWIGLMLLAPQTRHHGLGTRLISWLITEARAHHVSALKLGAHIAPPDVTRFWSHVGFVSTGLPVEFQSGSKSHMALIMECKL